MYLNLNFRVNKQNSSCAIYEASSLSSTNAFFFPTAATARHQLSLFVLTVEEHFQMMMAHTSR